MSLSLLLVVIVVVSDHLLLHLFDGCMWTECTPLDNHIVSHFLLLGCSQAGSQADGRQARRQADRQAAKSPGGRGSLSASSTSLWRRLLTFTLARPGLCPPVPAMLKPLRARTNNFTFDL